MNDLGDISCLAPHPTVWMQPLMGLPRVEFVSLSVQFCDNSPDCFTASVRSILATPATLVYYDGQPFQFSRSGWKEDVKV